MRSSVILCTYNPRPDYLAETLRALRAQTLPLEQWELLIVDNASATPLAGTYDISWHPRGRHLREEKLGLTPARLCGIHAAAGELIIFVDDDNVLARDYLAQSLRLAAEHPFLGAFGGGAVGRFEVAPPKWMEGHLAMLAVRDVARDIWSNQEGNWESTPVGAGLVVRRSLAMEYALLVERDPRRNVMDRRGASLLSGGDSDMTCLICERGFGVGRFKALSLEHLIPAERVTFDYMIRMQRGMMASRVLLLGLWGRETTPPAEGSIMRRMGRWMYDRFALSSKERAMLKAAKEGHAIGRKMLAEINSAPGAVIQGMKQTL